MKTLVFIFLALTASPLMARSLAADVCVETAKSPLQEQSETILKAVNTEGDKLYEEIKTQFLKSPNCFPENVMNNPQDKMSPILFSNVYEEMRFIIKDDPYMTRAIKIEQFKQLVKDYQLSGDTLNYGLSLLKNYVDTSDGRFDAMARIRGVVLQDMDKVSKKYSGYQREQIAEGLVKRHIFVEDDDGYPLCPFLSQDAFREALAGREQVMKSINKTKISNPDILTIVDFTRPSNERRMFVIDLKSKKVLHNTWSAQGGGVSRREAQGVDQLGSSPTMSNVMGSDLSSEGFYIAKKASSGEKFLNNVILEGIDSNNKNLSARNVVIHGWRTPGHDYTDKTWEIKQGKTSQDYKRVLGKDIYQEFMSIDFKNTKEDLFDISQPLASSVHWPDYMDATDGCLGVSETNMAHVDQKKRNLSQLEMLRQDLPGSLMFNFVGSRKTKSQYLKAE